MCRAEYTQPSLQYTQHPGIRGVEHQEHLVLHERVEDASSSTDVRNGAGDMDGAGDIGKGGGRESCSMSTSGGFWETSGSH